MNTRNDLRKRQASVRANEALRLLSKSVGINSETSSSSNNPVTKARTKSTTRVDTGTKVNKGSSHKTQKHNEPTPLPYDPSDESDEENFCGNANEGDSDEDTEDIVKRLLATDIYDLGQDDFSKSSGFIVGQPQGIIASNQVYIDTRRRLANGLKTPNDNDFDYGGFQENLSRDSLLGDAFCNTFLPRKAMETELYRMIIEQDCRGFFNFVENHLYVPIQLEKKYECDDGCICNPSVSKLPDRRGMLVFNPIQIAVIHNCAEILEVILFRYKEWFGHMFPEMTMERFQHFEFVRDKWLTEQLSPDKSSAYDLAVEYDATDCLRILMKTDRLLAYTLPQEEDDNKERVREGDKCFKKSYDAYFCDIPDSFLCKLAYHDKLDLVPREILAEMIEQQQVKIDRDMRKRDQKSVYTNKLTQALNDAICQESTKSVNILLGNIDEKYLIPYMKVATKFRCGRFHTNGSPIYPLPPSPIHTAIKYGNLSFLEKIPDKLRKYKDQYGYMALMECAWLEESNIEAAASLFDSDAEREELFIFLHHLILFKKFNVLYRVLSKYLANVKLFKPRRQEDEYYVVPIDTPLPLSSVLISSGDMEVFGNVLDIYSLFRIDENRKKFIQADVLYCAKIVQSEWLKYSEQLRLAIFLKLMRLVVIHDDRWKEIIEVHKRRNKIDRVADFIQKKFEIQRSCNELRNFKWKEALVQAREYVEQWNGSLEASDEIMYLKDRREFKRLGEDIKIEVDGTVPVLQSILKRRY